MALDASTAGVQASARVNGTTTPSPAEYEELYIQLLRLCDDVVAGRHPRFRLPPSAQNRLKASLASPVAPGTSNARSLTASSVFDTKHTQHQHPPLSPPSGPSGSVNATEQAYGAQRSSSGVLDPIFLEKADSLIKAEGQLKRQRLERDLQAQVDQRKHSSREKDPSTDTSSHLDVEGILMNAWERVQPISGLKVATKAASTASSSFDENDYYSSQVQSDWSSEASSSRRPNEAAGAFTAGFEALDSPLQSSKSLGKRHARLEEPTVPGSSVPYSLKDRPHVLTKEPEYGYDAEDDDDDEYSPPDAAAIDSFRGNGSVAKSQQIATPEDDSDYEPGELTQESNVPTPSQARPAEPTVQISPQVPVIRNHLTHIAAPQPNRVSPLATAKGPSIELELVNGRPEVVKKQQRKRNRVVSRISTGSPSGTGTGTGAGGSTKKRRKKRKREQELASRANKRQERQEVAPSPIQQAPFIKNEPLSPSPFGNLPVPPAYTPVPQYQPAEIDPRSSRYVPQTRYLNEPPRSGLRYEYSQPASPTVARVASASSMRPMPRDTQDLRRVASLRLAPRPTSPIQRIYSPVAPYHTNSATYGNSHVTYQPAPAGENDASRYTEQPTQIYDQYVRAERSRSPPRFQEQRGSYGDPAISYAQAPPPQPLSRRIVVDQYGHRYYAADPAPPPVPTPVPRASVAAVDRQPYPEITYERAPSRTAAAYPQSSPATLQGEYANGLMAPPPPPGRSYGSEQHPYEEANGYGMREYSTHSAEQARHANAATPSAYQPMPTYQSMPTYQPVPTYQPMPPPAVPPVGEQPPIVYQQVQRSYSMRQEEPYMTPTYIRQASVAPVQYMRQDAPPPPNRAVSVIPGADYGGPIPQPRVYSQTPSNIKYVDPYGVEVYPDGVRQEFRY